MEVDETRAGLRRWKSALDRAANRALGSLPELAAAQLESEARRLGPACIPRIFARDHRELDPSLNEAVLDLTGRAQQTLRNRFTFLNHAETFGQEIAWESSPRLAWRAELHSFDYALDLAILFRLSGEEGYARHLRYLVAHWIASNPPLEGTGWNPGPLARRFRNWVLASDLARAAWQADADFFQVASRSLALASACLAREARAGGEAPEAPEIAVALLLSSRLYDSPRAASHQALAIELLRRSSEQSFAGVGDCAEPGALARVRLARAFLEFVLFEPDFDQETSRWLKANLQRAVESVEEILLPDGTVPLFGASAPPSPGTLDDLFAAAAVVLDAPWCKTIAEGFGIFPWLLLGQSGKEDYSRLAGQERLPAHTTDSPAGVYRVAVPAHSGLAITASTTATAAGHHDLLSYELVLRGMRVIVDSGAYRPPDESGGDYFASPRAHNVLLVDGRLPGPGPPCRKKSYAAELSSTAEYTRLRISLPGEGPGLPARERVWFSLLDGAWIVLDRLEGGDPHRLLGLVHFFPTFEISLGNGLAIAQSHAMTLTVIPLGTSEARILSGRGEDSNFPGWYSPDYGIRYPSSVLALEWNSEGKGWLGGFLLLAGQACDMARTTVRLGSKDLVVKLAGRDRRLPLGDLVKPGLS